MQAVLPSRVKAGRLSRRHFHQQTRSRGGGADRRPGSECLTQPARERPAQGRLGRTELPGSRAE
jgi:hypothetical protein